MPSYPLAGVPRGFVTDKWIRRGLPALALAASVASTAGLSAQTIVGPGTTVETFNEISSGLPANWSVRTGASASALGTAGAFDGAHSNWSNTGGSFKNVASALSLTSSATTTAQANSTDRALAVRQTGSFGDPGAAFVFQVSTVGVSVSDVRFSAQIVSHQDRSTTWSLQYGLGADPTTFTTIGTFTDPGAFGATPVIASAFGDALNNQASIWLRVVALGGSTSTGTRDTFAIDDFSITASAIPEPGAFALFGGAAALGCALSRRRRV